MKIVLSKEEIYVLEKLAARTRMDCWFSVYTLNERNFGTRIKDLERGRIISLRSGVKSLCEGMGNMGAYGLNNVEIMVFQNLLRKLKL